MNKDNQLEQQLDRLGEQIASQPSILGAVMQRVETMEAPSVRRSHRLGRIVMKATMAIAASVLVGIAIWLGVTGGSASKAYGLQDFEQRLQTAQSYHLKGWMYWRRGGPNATGQVEKVPTEVYAARPCTFYRTRMCDNNGVIGTGYRAENAEKYIEVDHLSKTCSIGRNYPFATELFVVDELEQMPRNLMREGSVSYHKVRSEPIDGVEAEVYEAVAPNSPKEQRREVIWLNPATGMPVRMATYRQRQGQPEQLFLEYSLVEVDVPPPPGLISFESPAGYEVTRYDRGPEAAGIYNSTQIEGGDNHVFRFAYNISDRAVLICWGWYNTSTTPFFEPDPANPPGQPMRLILTGTASDRKYRLVTLRTDPGPEFHWRWSLLIPEDGKPIGLDQPSLIFRNKGGTGQHTTGTWKKISRGTLADFVVRSQRLTLPTDAPADAALTLEQIEAKIAELHQAPITQ